MKILVNKQDGLQNKPEQKSHRIFHVLNRNIKERYSFEDIQAAFMKADYTQATSNDRFVYDRFFKECDYEDLEKLIVVFDVSKNTIKNIYSSLPIRQLPGVAKVWDKYFDLEPLPNKIYTHDKIPDALKKILELKEQKNK